MEPGESVNQTKGESDCEIEMNKNTGHSANRPVVFVEEKDNEMTRKINVICVRKKMEMKSLQNVTLWNYQQSMVVTSGKLCQKK